MVESSPRIDPFKTCSFEFRSFSLGKLLAEVPVSEGAVIYHRPQRMYGLLVTFTRNGDVHVRLLVPTADGVKVISPDVRSTTQMPFAERLVHIRADDKRLGWQLLDAIHTYFTPERLAHVPLAEYVLGVQLPALTKLVESVRAELP